MSSDSHRVFALECRLEQMRASVDEARAEAHRARERLAETTANQADRGRQHQLLHDELAAAREEIVLLHRQLEHSEALRAGLEGRLFEGATPEDAEELLRLRAEVAAYRDLTAARQKLVSDLQARVGDLVAGRETLLSRVTEWQSAVQEGNADAVDLAEFIAMLTGDILELEHRRVAAEQRGAGLEEQLIRAREQGFVDVEVAARAEVSTEPADEARVTVASETAEAADAATAQPAEPVQVAEPVQAAEPVQSTEMPEMTAVSEPAERSRAEVLPPKAEVRPPRAEPRPPKSEALPPRAEAPPPPPAPESTDSRIDALLRLGRNGDPRAFDTITAAIADAEPRVRASAYQALGQLLGDEPKRLELYIRRGVTDPDSRVRRRVILTAAAARGLDCEALLEPLKRDPDPQVLRVVKEVLRRVSPGTSDAPVDRVSTAQGS